MLRAGCIKSYKREDGETLISVMSRHTLSDGHTLDPDITEGSFDEHWPELAPFPTDVGSYYRQEIGFEELARRYRERLENDPRADRKAFDLAIMASTGNVVVMCVEPDGENCHRGVLLDYMLERFPVLGELDA